MDISDMNQEIQGVCCEQDRDDQGSHSINQWHNIGTKDNPEDYSSRGIDVVNDKAVQKRFQGPPSFL